MSFLPLTLCGLALMSCSTRIDISPYPSARVFLSDPRLEQPETLPEVSFRFIHCGSNSTLEAFLFRGGSWFQGRPLTFPAILVEHPKGDLLIDAGLGPEIDHQFDEEMPFLLKPLMAFDPGPDPRSALQTAGFDPDRIRHILLTHLHWDHAGGIESFPKAQIWHPEEGLLEARTLAPEDSAYFREQFDDPDIQWSFHDFPDGPYENFHRSFDFYGDGSIVLVPLAGHTATSLGVFLNLRDGRRFLFSGDTTWSVEGFTRPSHKFWLSRWLVDADVATLEYAIVQVHLLMQRYPQLRVIPSHDLEAMVDLPNLPGGRISDGE